MIFSVKNLNFSYDGENNIFSNINFNIEEGKIYTILGRNGIGKSTLFNILLNIYKNYTGEILFLNKNLKLYSNVELAKCIGYVPQNPKLYFDYSAFDYVKMGLISKVDLFNEVNKEQEQLVYEVFDKMNIKHLINKNMFSMSGGEVQQVCIARSIVAKPKVIILDEPTSHLDLGNQIKVLKIITKLKEDGFTIIVSMHDPNLSLLLKGEGILLDKNYINCGKIEELINEENLNKIYGIDLVVKKINDEGKKICYYNKL